jgi:hypothetical protein
MEFATGSLDFFTDASLHSAQREGIWTNPAEVPINRFLFLNQIVTLRREMPEQIDHFREDL